SSSELAFQRVLPWAQDSPGQHCDGPHAPVTSQLRNPRSNAKMTMGFRDRCVVKHHLITSRGSATRRSNGGPQTHVQKALSFLVQGERQAEALYVYKGG